ncbi:hypothetical protein BSKO_06544 [Bryopsis sp. KO-2023]|nr:hypothetical protein BSKO_06544 [Bryopsis sp. KO-2023]
MAGAGVRSLIFKRALPRTLLPVRGGGGGPVAREPIPTQALPESDDFIWYDGTANPEGVLDKTDIVTSNQALGALTLGFCGFAAIGVAGYLYNPVSRSPFIPKEFPYDNLKVEMGLEAKK